MNKKGKPFNIFKTTVERVDDLQNRLEDIENQMILRIDEIEKKDVSNGK